MQHTPRARLQDPTNSIEIWKISLFALEYAFSYNHKLIEQLRNVSGISRHPATYLSMSSVLIMQIIPFMERQCMYAILDSCLHASMLWIITKITVSGTMYDFRLKVWI